MDSAYDIPSPRLLYGISGNPGPYVLALKCFFPFLVLRNSPYVRKNTGDLARLRQARSRLSEISEDNILLDCYTSEKN